MNVILFGAGMLAQKCEHYVERCGDKILCFVDNDKTKHSTTINLEPAGGGGAETRFVFFLYCLRYFLLIIFMQPTKEAALCQAK